MVGKLEVYLGEKLFFNDWMNYFGIMYFEVRLKKYLEMRGVDCCLKDFFNVFFVFWVSFVM